MTHPLNSIGDVLARMDERQRALMIWRPIETAPKDQEILACGPRMGRLVVEFDEYANPDFPWATLDGPNYFKDEFTHWMVLPDLPYDSADQTVDAE